MSNKYISIVVLILCCFFVIFIDLFVKIMMVYFEKLIKNKKIFGKKNIIDLVFNEFINFNIIL